MIPLGFMNNLLFISSMDGYDGMESEVPQRSIRGAYGRAQEEEFSS
jgi:hypothetical protein